MGLHSCTPEHLTLITPLDPRSSTAHTLPPGVSHHLDLSRRPPRPVTPRVRVEIPEETEDETYVVVDRPPDPLGRH